MRITVPVNPRHQALRHGRDIRLRGGAMRQESLDQPVGSTLSGSGEAMSRVKSGSRISHIPIILKKLEEGYVISACFRNPRPVLSSYRRNAEPVEGIGEILRDRYRVATFDLMAFQHEDDLTVLKNPHGRR